MKKFVEPSRDLWAEIVTRPGIDTAKVEEVVPLVLEAIQQEGDSAVRAYTEKFQGEGLYGSTDATPEVTEQEWAEAESQVSPELKQAIDLAAANIETFHKAQSAEPLRVETMPGVVCERRSVPIQRVGLYVPGGTAPLFSTVLMLAIPAKVAGCPEIIMTSPAGSEGKLHPAMVYAAKQAGVSRFFKVGGAQAIAAMGYGTESVPKVDKLFGPGNQYVTYAKQLLAKEGVAIDMPAGPSEVAVYADEGANPDFVAMDLLSQAEHGSDSQVLLVVPKPELLDAVQTSLVRQLQTLPRAVMAQEAIKNSRGVVLADQGEAIALLNEYAAEHLILACEDADELATKITQAGSIFLGHWTPESVGDYASGTNHTLPTNGAARAFSGVSLDSFVKKITYQRLSEKGLMNLGPAVETMAEAEGLDAHRLAVRLRLEQLGK